MYCSVAVDCPPPCFPVIDGSDSTPKSLKSTVVAALFGYSLSTISPDEYFDSVHRIVSLLDVEHVTILRTMKQHGARNLLEIPRKAKLLYLTLYNRVPKLANERHTKR